MAAMTLHNKICSDFNTLNAASCAGLRTTLVEHLAKYVHSLRSALVASAVVAHMAILYHHRRRRESRLVLGRLARAVAALATQWREWKDVVKMTVQTFGASPDKYACCRGCTLLLHTPRRSLLGCWCSYKIMIALLCEFAEESVSYRVRADRVARREFQVLVSGCWPVCFQAP